MTINTMQAKEHIWFNTWMGFNPDVRAKHLKRLDIGIDPDDPQSMIEWLKTHGWSMITRNLPRSSLSSACVENLEKGIRYEFPTMPEKETIKLAVLYAHFFDSNQEDWEITR